MKLTFEPIQLPTRYITKAWEVKGNVKLGVVKWYAQWRRYVFYPEKDTLFDSDCMNQIKTFLDNQMYLRKVKALEKKER